MLVHPMLYVRLVELEMVLQVVQILQKLPPHLEALVVEDETQAVEAAIGGADVETSLPVLILLVDVISLIQERVCPKGILPRIQCDLHQLLVDIIDQFLVRQFLVVIVRQFLVVIINWSSGR